MSEMLNEKKPNRYTHATIKKKTKPWHLAIFCSLNDLIKKKIKVFFSIKKKDKMNIRLMHLDNGEEKSNIGLMHVDNVHYQNKLPLKCH